MRRTVALVPVFLALPATLAAQSRTSFSAYTSTGADLTAARIGTALGTETNGLGYRLGVAVGAASRPAGEPADWATDLDGTAHLGRLVPGLEGTRLFAGVGMGGMETGGVVLSTSMGASYTHHLTGPLAVEVEGRYRVPLAESEPARLEVRAGFALAFPRGRARRPLAIYIPAERPGAAPAAPAAPAAVRALALRAIGTGEGYLGIPYKWGGNTPEEGFDCSGFLRYVFRAHGIEIPRVTRDQALVGDPLPTRIEELRPGDLMFFASNGVRIDHAAMYVGEGRILHSSASGKGVRYDDLNTQRGEYYRTHFVAARRVLTEEVVGRVEAAGVR